ncbi:MAG: hypothetical protein MI892_23750 [Desulfobacterales bacterium]|nr:hypothetical protein [Desulfobacterales bacterium]
MTGISEVLVLILLITGILILPRMLKPAPKKATNTKVASGPVSMKMRAGIVASILFLIICTLVIKPWQGDLILFISIGILPVALIWSIFWIFSAKNK